MRARLVVVMLFLGCVPQRSAGPEPAGVPAGIAASFSVQVGEAAVTLALHITNATSEPVSLEFGSSQRYDVEIWSGGTRIWRWSDGRVFTQAVGNDVLRPGETRQYAVTWPEPGRHGGFVAVGRLTSRNYPVELRSEFVLPDP